MSEIKEHLHEENEKGQRDGLDFGHFWANVNDLQILKWRRAIISEKVKDLIGELDKIQIAINEIESKYKAQE